MADHVLLNDIVKHPSFDNRSLQEWSRLLHVMKLLGQVQQPIVVLLIFRENKITISEVKRYHLGKPANKMSGIVLKGCRFQLLMNTALNFVTVFEKEYSKKTALAGICIIQ